jgi:hypothetical protein
MCLVTDQGTLASLCRDRVTRDEADDIFCCRRLVFTLVHAQDEGGVLGRECEPVLVTVLQVTPGAFVPQALLEC